MLKSALVERTLEVDDIALSEPDFWAMPESEREGAFAVLREQRPVSFQEEVEFPGLPKGKGYWALTRFDDVRMVSRDAATYISGQGTAVPDFPPFLREFFGSMINMDDPRHTQLRRVVSAAFTPTRVRALDAYVDIKAREVVDRLCALGGECDFVEHVAAPFPLEIICEMMGVEKAHWPKVLGLTNVILSGGDPEIAPSMDAILRAAVEMAAIGRETANDRLKNPRDDLVSAMVQANPQGERLSPDEFASFFILLAAAGNETTRTAISHGLKALTDFPEQRAKLLATPSLMASAAEEIVRWATPVISFRRTTTRDVEIRGQKIGAGEKVVLFYNSANRDEAAFQHPFAFDVARTPNDHLGFGGGGTHFCLGANLARREIASMFRELLARVPDLHVVGEPDILQSGFIHGVKRMRCAWKP